MKNSARSTYQILNWLADNATHARDLCNLLTEETIVEQKKVIKKIIDDISVLNAKVKEYFKTNRVLRSDEDYIKLVKFVAGIYDDCYHKHCKSFSYWSNLFSENKGFQ